MINVGIATGGLISGGFNFTEIKAQGAAADQWAERVKALGDEMNAAALDELMSGEFAALALSGLPFMLAEDKKGVYVTVALALMRHIEGKYHSWHQNKRIEPVDLEWLRRMELFLAQIFAVLNVPAPVRPRISDRKPDNYSPFPWKPFLGQLGAAA
jgi:hypothetical protein